MTWLLKNFLSVYQHLINYITYQIRQDVVQCHLQELLKGGNQLKINAHGVNHLLMSAPCHLTSLHQLLLQCFSPLYQQNKYSENSI